MPVDPEARYELEGMGAQFRKRGLTWADVKVLDPEVLAATANFNWSSGYAVVHERPKGRSAKSGRYFLVGPNWVLSCHGASIAKAWCRAVRNARLIRNKTRLKNENTKGRVSPLLDPTHPLYRPKVNPLSKTPEATM